MKSLSKLVFALALAITYANFANTLAAQDLQVYFFTMDRCPPCKQMEPVVDRLKNEGYPVRKIDLNSNSQIARQFNVQQTPTTIIVAGNQAIAQQSGIIGYMPLKEKLDQIISQQRSQQSSVANANSNGNYSAANFNRNAASENREYQSTSSGNSYVSTNNSHSYTNSNNASTVEEKAFRATVRLKVIDDKGAGFATGTVIHSHGNDALILTCGHVFRESKGQGKIMVDIGFGTNNIQTVEGRLLDYDADKHDIALVAFRPGISIEPVSVGRRHQAVRSNDAVFSIGCNGGKNPTIRRSNVIKPTSYSGVTKYDVIGQPVLGRSGGGLFNSDGELIGVCNAAVVDANEGIYAAIPTIHWQFEQVNLAHLFQPNPQTQPNAVGNLNSQVASNSESSFNSESTFRNGNGNRGGNVQIQTNQDLANANLNGANLNGANLNGNRFDQQNPRTANLSGGKEIIMLIRDPRDPTKTETITINQPTDELIDMIRVAQSGHLNQPRDQRIPRSLPNVPSEIPLMNDNARAQSPK